MINKKDLIGLAKVLNKHINQEKFNRLGFLKDLYSFLALSNPNFNIVKFRQAVFKELEDE